MWILFKTLIAAITIAIVSEIARRSPRTGAFLLTLLLSIIAIVIMWVQYRDHFRHEPLQPRKL